MLDCTGEAQEVKFRDPELASALGRNLIALVGEIGRAPITLMHVCGSHEQAIAKYGLRARFPKALDVIMGPGCPVCVTDAPEVDEGVELARQGVHVATLATCSAFPERASLSRTHRPRVTRSTWSTVPQRS